MAQIELTIDESLLMVDALNGTLIYPEMAAQLLSFEIADAIAIDHLDNKWSVDGAALVAKLKTLDNAEANELLAKINKFWGEQYHQSNSRQRVLDISLATEELITPTTAAKLSGKSLQSLSALAAKGVITRYSDPNEPNPQRRSRYLKREIKSLSKGRLKKAR